MRRPAPRPGPYDEPYWRYAAAGELRLQRCAACGHVRYPPGPVCPECLVSEHTWDLLSGTGRLLAWTVFHRPYFPEIPVPYVVAVVRVPEGPNLVGNLLGTDLPVHGMPLRAVHEDATAADGTTFRLCQWVPADPRVPDRSPTEEHA